MKRNNMKHNNSGEHKRKTPLTVTTNDYSVFGGYCRIHITSTDNLTAVGKTDMHCVCRFCLLALNVNDAIARLSGAGVTDFAFLTRSLSAVEISLCHFRHGILNSPIASTQVYVASVSDCYTSANAYALFIRVDEPTPQCAPTTPITIATSLRTKGFLERLLPSFRGLLSKPGDKGKR